VLPRADTSTVSAAAPAQRAADAAAPPAPAAPEAAVGGAGCAPGAGGGAGSPGAVGAAGGGGPGSAAAAGGGVGAPGSAVGGAAPGAGACVNGGSGAGGGAAASGVGAPLGPGATTCADRQDPALRALLVQVLPEAANAPPAATTDVCLPGSERYVSLELVGGVFTVAYLPPGTVASLAPGATSARTATGGTVIVSPPPALDGRAPAVLQYLAPRL